MAGWAGDFSLLGQGCSEILPVLPARTVPPPGPTAWQVQGNLRELYASLCDSNEENFSLKILKKIWLVLQWVFYVGYILYKVSLIQYFCISLLFSENVLQYSACAFLKGFGRWKREATTLLSSYTKYTVGRKKQINTIFIYSGILDKGFLCFSANISSSWPLWSILALKFLKADTETLLCNCSARVWTCCDSGYTAMKKGTHPRGESYFAFNRDGKRD